MSGFLEGLTTGAGTAVKFAGIYVGMDLVLYVGKAIVDECRSRAHFRATGADVWSPEKVGAAFTDRFGSRQRGEASGEDSAQPAPKGAGE